MPLTQSFLPVVLANGSIPGLLAIPVTVFAGNETTFNLSVGSVTIAKKTLKVTNMYPRVREYMAATFNHVQSVRKQYAQFAEWIPIEYIMPAAQWQQNSMTERLDYFNGVMLTCLKVGFKVPIGAPIVGTPPVANAAPTMNLKVNAPFANIDGATFFDFNWVDLFQAQFPTKSPASIQVTAQPAAGDLLAYVISGGQVVAGQITQNTIRIVKVVKGNVAAGNRVFTFRIFDQSQASPMMTPSNTLQGVGGTLGAGTYTYRVSAIVDGKETVASPTTSRVVGAGTTNQITLTWPNIPNATGYHVYGRTTMKRLATLGAGVTTYVDTGAAVPGSQDPILNAYTDVTLTVTVS